MDPLAGNFFGMPWPSDSRTAADGTLELDGLPGVELLPGETPTYLRSQLPSLVEELGSSLTGFGVNTAAYFDSDLSLNTATLPSPQVSTFPGSSVMLLDLDHPGERAPVIVDFQATGDRNRPDDLLTVLPYPGHPLRESNRYAVALLDGIRTGSGQPLAPAPLLSQLDDPWTTGTGLSEEDWNLLRDQRDEVRSLLDSTTSWGGSDLVAFTAFTTQDVDGDMRSVADAIDAMAAPGVDVTSQGPCVADSRAGGTLTSSVAGTIELTRWQNGTYPYYDDGGEIVVDAGGLAVPQGSFDAEFTARVPCGPAPAQGWPLLTFIDGTGGTFDLNSTILPLTYEGYVIAEISPVYGVGRDIVITPLMSQLGITNLDDAAEFTFYNFLNADAVRTNTIQQAAENLQLLEAMENIQIDGTTVGTTGMVGTDPATQVIAGQSQGAQTLPMVAAMRPSLAGVVSSAGSGGLYHTISHVSGNRGFLGQMTGDAAALDELNPIVQVAQTMLEGGDGTNFDSSVNYLQYHGAGDTCVPFENVAALRGRHRPTRLVRTRTQHHLRRSVTRAGDHDPARAGERGWPHPGRSRAARRALRRL